MYLLIEYSWYDCIRVYERDRFSHPNYLENVSCGKDTRSNQLLGAFKKAFVPPREREFAEGVHNSYRRLFFSARSGK
jgi:hypothetical protein